MGKSWSSCKRNDPGTASSIQQYEAPKETDEVQLHEPVVPPAPHTVNANRQALLDLCKEIQLHFNGTQPPPPPPESDSKGSASVEAVIKFDRATNLFI